MSDSNQYVNSYIGVVTKQLHDNLTETIQNRTEIKVLKNILLEKDNLISDLTNQKAGLEKERETSNKNGDLAREWEQKHNAMVNKVSHMDTLLKQVSDMRQTVIEKDLRIKELEDKIQTLSKPPINKRNKKQKDVSPLLLPIANIDTSIEKSVDDF